MKGCHKPLYKHISAQISRLLVSDVPQKARYSRDRHVRTLLTASLVNGYAEGVSKCLDGSPTGETVLTYLQRQDRAETQAAFDRLTERQVRSLKRRKKLQAPVPIAIDWHDVMYYGDPATPMVLGTQHKKGSAYAYEYLTASVLVDGERLIVAVLPIPGREDVPRLTQEVLRRIAALAIRISYLTLDGGFFSIHVLRFLEESGIRYIMHMPRTSRTKRMRLWRGRRFRYTTNHHTRGPRQQASFDVVVAYDLRKRYRYLLATNMRYGDKTLLGLFLNRWGIETSYRICNQFLVRTTSRNYTVRMFYYLMACAMYNTWVLQNEDGQLPVLTMKVLLLRVTIRREREEGIP